MSSSPKSGTPFGFEISFDEFDPAKAPKILTASEIAAMKAESFALGKQAGFEEMQTSMDTAVQLMVETLWMNFQNLATEKKELYESAREEFLTLFKESILRVSPVAANLSFVDEVLGHLDQMTHGFGERMMIHISVHPDMRGPLEEKILKGQKVNGLDIIFEENPDLKSIGDYKIYWKNGGIEKQLEKIMGKIDSCIQAYAHNAQTLDEEEDHK